MPGFVHIDISADDPQRAADFFAKAFGWSIQKLEGAMPYWLVTPPPFEGQPPGVGGGIAKRTHDWESVTPTIDVPSVDESEARIKDAGGTVIVPKQLIPGVGYLLTFRDTEGNVFAILEPVAESQFT